MWVNQKTSLVDQVGHDGGLARGKVDIGGGAK